MREPVTAHVGTAAPSPRSGQALGCPAGRSPAPRWHKTQLSCHTRCLFALAILLSPPLLAASDCLPIREASQHVGETKCVTGKVLRVKVGAKGVHFVDFCEDQMACPFTVVVFRSEERRVGDVRRLAGRVIEIHGAVKLYDGRAEMILNRISQITGGAAMIPPLPKNYDVENRGHYSAGHRRTHLRS